MFISHIGGGHTDLHIRVELGDIIEGLPQVWSVASIGN